MPHGFGQLALAFGQLAPWNRTIDFSVMTHRLKLRTGQLVWVLKREKCKWTNKYMRTRKYPVAIPTVELRFETNG